MGAPALLSFSPSSESNSRHSWPKSIIFSSMTRPQSLQMTSPFSLFQVRLMLPHSGHFFTYSAILVPPIKLNHDKLSRRKKNIQNHISPPKKNETMRLTYNPQRTQHLHGQPSSTTTCIIQ